MLRMEGIIIRTSQATKSSYHIKMRGEKTLILLGLSSLVALSFCADPRAENKVNQTQLESEKKKPNILKDYICLRDGELCHPDFARNRGNYVSCSNGVAWEQQCPKCVYHPLACPTRSLWFDGEKCDWASPKLASQPCIDKIQPNPYEQINGQQSVFQSLEPVSQPNYDYHPIDKSQMSKWPQMPYPSNQVQNPSFKPSKQKYGSEYYDSNQVRTDSSKEYENNNGPLAELVQTDQVRSQVDISDINLPNYLRLDDAPPMDGNKMIKLREPVYTMVDSDDGKQVLMKISEPFVIDESARDPLPNMNIISVDSLKN